MPFRTDGPSLDEARLFTLKGLITAKSADLETVCRLPSSPGGTDQLLPNATVTSMVTNGTFCTLGDPEEIPDSPDFTPIPPFMIALTGGGERDGLDFTADLMTNEGQFKVTFSTNIYIYVFNTAFPVADNTWANVVAQVQKREVLRARVCDWLRGDVFSPDDRSALEVVTTSKEYYYPAFDKFTHGYLRQGYKGYYRKSFGGSIDCLAAHLVHQGYYT